MVVLKMKNYSTVIITSRSMIVKRTSSFRHGFVGRKISKLVIFIRKTVDSDE